MFTRKGFISASAAAVISLAMAMHRLLAILRHWHLARLQPLRRLPAGILTSCLAGPDYRLEVALRQKVPSCMRRSVQLAMVLKVRAWLFQGTACFHDLWVVLGPSRRMHR